MKELLKQSRPRFWIYVFGPFILPLATLQSIHGLSFSLILVGLYFTFPANIFIYGVNDIYDKETDMHNDKKKSYETEISKQVEKKVKIVLIIITLIILLYSVFFLTLITTASILLFLICAHQYSAPPLRAKAIPFLDSIVSGVLYTIPAFVSWTMIHTSMPPLWPFIAACIWSMSMHAYSAVPDIEADKQAHIHTGATILGKNTMLVMCAILYIIASIIVVPYLGIFAYIAGLIYLMLIILSIATKTSGATLRYYKMFPIINTLVGFGIFIKILLQ